MHEAQQAWREKLAAFETQHAPFYAQRDAIMADPGGYIALPGRGPVHGHDGGRAEPLEHHAQQRLVGAVVAVGVSRGPTYQGSRSMSGPA